MGHHYVPQEYLRHFAPSSDPESVWILNKGTEEFKLLPIKVVAQSPDFYSHEDEKWLNKNVEIPAHAPLNKLRSVSQITDDERWRVSQYIQLMVTRGPVGRLRALEIVSQNKTEILEETRSALRDEALDKCISETAYLNSFEPLLQEWDSKQLTVNDDLIKYQQQVPEVIACIYLMTWIVIKARSPGKFLTSDNPVFKGPGLGNPQAVFIFPISSDVAILGSWRGAKEGLHFVDGKRDLVKQINYRVASAAQDFLFYHQKFPWVREILRSGGLG